MTCRQSSSVTEFMPSTRSVLDHLNSSGGRGAANCGLDVSTRFLPPTVIHQRRRLSSVVVSHAVSAVLGYASISILYEWATHYQGGQDPRFRPGFVLLLLLGVAALVYVGIGSPLASHLALIDDQPLTQQQQATFTSLLAEKEQLQADLDLALQLQGSSDLLALQLNGYTPASIIDAGTPADLILQVVAGLREGRAPTQEDLILIQGLVQGGHDIFQPVDLAEQLENMYLDDDVGLSLQAALGLLRHDYASSSPLGLPRDRSLPCDDGAPPCDGMPPCGGPDSQRSLTAMQDIVVAAPTSDHLARVVAAAMPGRQPAEVELGTDVDHQLCSALATLLQPSQQPSRRASVVWPPATGASGTGTPSSSCASPSCSIDEQQRPTEGRRRSWVDPNGLLLSPERLLGAVVRRRSIMLNAMESAATCMFDGENKSQPRRAISQQQMGQKRDPGASADKPQSLFDSSKEAYGRAVRGLVSRSKTSACLDNAGASRNGIGAGNGWLLSSAEMLRPSQGLSERDRFLRALSNLDSSDPGPPERPPERSPSMHPHRSPALELPALLAMGCEEWSCDMHGLSQACQMRPLSSLGFYLLHSTGLKQHFNMSDTVLCRFLRRIEEGYPTSNNYHNRIHAAQVLHRCHMFITKGGLLPACDPLTRLSLYLAAMVHDYQHPGVTNDYLCVTEAPLATLYNDRAPTENHHCAATFALLQQPGFNVLSGMNKKDYGRLRKLVIELVLATDMKQHFSILSQFMSVNRLTKETAREGGAGGKGRSARTAPATADQSAAASDRNSGGSSGPAGSSRSSPDRPSGGTVRSQGRAAWEEGKATVETVGPMDETARLLMLQVVLKAADISHLADPWDMHRRWVHGLEEEFFRQGDSERQRGLPITPLFDRNKPGITKSQVGFFEIVAVPLFRALAIAFPGTTPVFSMVLANHHNWSRLERSTKDLGEQAKDLGQPAAKDLGAPARDPGRHAKDLIPTVRDVA